MFFIHRIRQVNGATAFAVYRSGVPPPNRANTVYNSGQLSDGTTMQHLRDIRPTESVTSKRSELGPAEISRPLRMHHWYTTHGSISAAKLFTQSILSGK